MTQAAIQGALRALRDISGVHGSFVVSSAGVLVSKDLPAVFHDELFLDVGARLSRFLETMDAEQDEVISAMLRFDEQRLYVSRLANGLLAVITANAINAAALKMALTLTARRLEPIMTAAVTAPPPVVSSAPPPPAAATSRPSVAPTRIYRGRVVPT